jgi:hypothetical protein
MIMGPDGARNQKRLCWRGPTVIYWTVLELVGSRQSEAGVRSRRLTAHSLSYIVRRRYKATTENIEDLTFAEVIYSV